MSIEVRVLGPLTIAVDGRVLDIGGPRQRALVGLLVLERNRVISADALADRLWPEEQPATAIKTVQVYVSRLRAQLGTQSDRLETVAGGYRLRLDDEELDAARFERDLRAARGRPSTPAAAREAAINAALSAWRGSAFVDIADLPTVRVEAERLEDLHTAAIEDAFDAAIDAGHARDSVGGLRAAVRERPERERLWALLMRALYAEGRQVEALAAYREARTYLVEELGLEPGQELRDLEGSILRQELVVAPRERATVPTAVDTPQVAATSSSLDQPAAARTVGPRPARARSAVERGGMLLAGAALVVIAVLLAAALLPSAGNGPTGLISGSSSPSSERPAGTAAARIPTPSSIPATPLPSVIAVQPDLGDGNWKATLVSPGRWTWQKFQPALTFTTGAEWWAGADGADAAQLLYYAPEAWGSGPPRGEIDLLRAQLVLDRPCYLPDEPTRVLDDGAAAVVDWLQQHPLLKAGPARPFDVGAFPGLSVDVTVARAKTEKDCPDERDMAQLLRRIPLFPATEGAVALFPNDRAVFIAVNVDQGPPLVILEEAAANEWDRFDVVAQPLLRSLEVQR